MSLKSGWDERRLTVKGDNRESLICGCKEIWIPFGTYWHSERHFTPTETLIKLILLVGFKIGLSLLDLMLEMQGFCTLDFVLRTQACSIVMMTDSNVLIQCPRRPWSRWPSQQTATQTGPSTTSSTWTRDSSSHQRPENVGAFTFLVKHNNCSVIQRVFIYNNVTCI